jgi:hypothetical protein
VPSQVTPASADARPGQRQPDGLSALTWSPDAVPFHLEGPALIGASYFGSWAGPGSPADPRVFGKVIEIAGQNTCPCGLHYSPEEWKATESVSGRGSVSVQPSLCYPGDHRDIALVSEQAF